jgi:hypothetical protein
LREDYFCLRRSLFFVGKTAGGLERFCGGIEGFGGV